MAGDEACNGLVTRLERLVRSRSGKECFHLDKVALARAVTASLEQRATASGAEADAELARAQTNFTLLLAALARRQRLAVRTEAVDKISSRINRAKRQFLRTQRGNARREDVLPLIEEISDQLDNSPDAEDVRATMRRWREQFHLDEDPRAQIHEYPHSSKRSSRWRIKRYTHRRKNADNARLRCPEP
jgi:hypothetical protein